MTDACSSCRFWRAGECRACPPVVVDRLVRVDDASMSLGEVVALATAWPRTPADGWCGKFEG